MFRSAIVGLGRIGCGFDDYNSSPFVFTHAGAYSKSKKIEIAALCDIEKKRLVRYGEKYNVKRLYQDYNQMFKKEKLDFVSICTHANSHHLIVDSAVRTGIKGIFLEKPISNSLHNAKKIIRICNKNGVKLQVDHQRRFSQFYQALRKRIVSKTFGKIQMIHGYYNSGIFNTGTHLLDLIRFFAGDFAEIRGEYSNFPSRLENDPNVNGNFILQNGGFGSIYAIDAKNYRILELDIIGTRARVIVNLANATAKYFEINNKKTNLVYKELIEKSFPIVEKKENIVLGLENLISSYEEDEIPLSSGEDGYAALEACVAFVYSAKKNGLPVNIPVSTSIHKFSTI